MHTGINRVFSHLFTDNKWGKSFADFKYELNSHPDFPTLKSIADTLEKFDIKNVPVRLNSNKLKQCLLDLRDGSFVTVNDGMKMNDNPIITVISLK